MLKLVVLVFNIAVGLASTESPGNCNFSSIPVQDDFNITQFLGSWYEYGRTEIEGGNTVNSISRVFTLYEASNGSTYITTNEYFVGQSCLEVQPFKLRQATTSSRLILVLGQRKFIFQVSYTDYDHIALIYICYKEEANGICMSKHRNIGFWTRYVPISEFQLEALNEKLDIKCVTSRDILFRKTGLCVAPTPNPLLVG